jgi:hypothetical protein
MSLEDLEIRKHTAPLRAELDRQREKCARMKRELAEKVAAAREEQREGSFIIALDAVTHSGKYSLSQMGPGFSELLTKLKEASVTATPLADTISDFRLTVTDLRADLEQAAKVAEQLRDALDARPCATGECGRCDYCMDAVAWNTELGAARAELAATEQLLAATQAERAADVERAMERIAALEAELTATKARNVQFQSEADEERFVKVVQDGREPMLIDLAHPEAKP